MVMEDDGHGSSPLAATLLYIYMAKGVPAFARWPSSRMTPKTTEDPKMWHSNSDVDDMHNQRGLNHAIPGWKTLDHAAQPWYSAQLESAWSHDTVKYEVEIRRDGTIVACGDAILADGNSLADQSEALQNGTGAESGHLKCLHITTRAILGIPIGPGHNGAIGWTASCQGVVSLLYSPWTELPALLVRRL